MTEMPSATPVGMERTEALRALILKSLDDDQAENVVVVDLEDKSSIADSMIIASGRSARHVSAVADHIIREMKESGFPKANIEGMPNCDWVLIDAGDVVVHVFRPEVREFYNLERIWTGDVAVAAD